uniref:Metal-binding protein n=1 Tax=Geoglobus ahangari TaxID=113653 RepID=A0A7C4WE87_9EURY
MRCRNCQSELEEDLDFCLFCNTRNADCSAIYYGKKLLLVFIGDRVRTTGFKIYEEPESLRNLFEIVAEKIHRKRVDEVFVCGEDQKKIDFADRMIRTYALSDLKSYISEPMDFKEFLENLMKFLKKKREIAKVEIPPDKKIGGSHSTIIGGREGINLVLKIASSEYVKKIVPGVIENSGTATGGVRLKLTRTDEKGNIKGLLIHGGSVQQLYIITTAKDMEEGEFILKSLRHSVN